MRFQVGEEACMLHEGQSSVPVLPFQRNRRANSCYEIQSQSSPQRQEHEIISVSHTLP